MEFCDGSARKTETYFGWDPDAVELRLQELRSGIVCLGDQWKCGQRKTEVKVAGLAAEIRALVEPESQADPQLRTQFASTRVTAQGVYDALRASGWSEAELPTRRTISKKAETDAIFANLKEVNRAAQANPQCLRLSLDAKATVAVGAYSRRGRSRAWEPVRALDHELEPKTKLIPFGILNLATSEIDLCFGTSPKTSDLVADYLAAWWERVAPQYPHVTELVLNCDNGPERNSHRTQLLKRMVEFADATQLRLHLMYYPPYHRKYNPIERCWAALEHHWNGTLLTSTEIVLGWARTMTWKGVRPVVILSETVYHKGISLGKPAMEAIEARLQRLPLLPRWDVLINPISSG